MTGAAADQQPRLAVSRDLKKLAVADQRKLEVWSIPDGSLLYSATASFDWSEVAFTRDGKYVLSADDMPQSVHYRPIDAAELIRVACSSVVRRLTRDEWARHFPGRDYAPACADSLRK
jgi:hypothetical protein